MKDTQIPLFEAYKSIRKMESRINILVYLYIQFFLMTMILLCWSRPASLVSLAGPEAGNIYKEQSIGTLHT